MIRRGDMLHCDVRIRYLGLCTDMQHLAYVLRQGETDAPAGLKALLRRGNRLQEIHFAEMKEGLVGRQLQGCADGHRQGEDPEAAAAQRRHEAYLRELGARDVVTPEALELGTRPLESARFGGAIDNVGGPLLAGLQRHVNLFGNVAAIGNAITIRDAGSGAEVVSLPAHSGSIKSTAFSPDGRRLVSLTDNGEVRVFDTASGRQAAVLHQTTGACTTRSWTVAAKAGATVMPPPWVAFSDDGREIRLTTMRSESTGVLVTITTWDSSLRR